MSSENPTSTPTTQPESEEPKTNPDTVPNNIANTDTTIPNNKIEPTSPNLEVPEPEQPKIEKKTYEQQPPQQPTPPRQMPTIPQQANLAPSSTPNTGEQFREIYNQSPRKAVKFFENNAEELAQELAKNLL